MYFHSQNLKKDHREKGLVNWRCWWKISNRTQFTFSISIPSDFWHIDINLCENGWQEQAIGFSIACPLFALWFGFENNWLYDQLEKITKRKDEKYTDGRSIGLSYHGGTFWFSLWETPMESRSSDPKWWKFNFDPADFFLGKPKYAELVKERGDIKIDMPEGVYDATFKRFISYWKRQRSLHEKSISRIEIVIPVGIPHEGKGENSWDMGMDATFSITMPAEEDEPINEIINKFAIDCLKERQKHGSLSSGEYLKWKTEGEFRQSLEEASGVKLNIVSNIANSSGSEEKVKQGKL